MKTVNKLCHILTVFFGLASLALFFTNFAKVVVNVFAPQQVSFIGAALGFGAKTEIAGTTYDMAKSADILFCFILAAIGLLLSIFSFKSKKIRYATPVFGLGAGIYMLVIALSDANKFVDLQPIANFYTVDGNINPNYLGAGPVEYTPFVLLTAIALLLFGIAAVAYLLVDDYIEVMQSKGAKRTIVKRVIAFFKDYKSEVKKIVWPGPRDVVKNTLIVLAVCLVIGVYIWLIDLGLGKLITDVILKRG